jgi:hypothetical protein
MGNSFRQLESVKHLSSQAKEVLGLNDQERIKYIRVPRWIKYSKAEQIIEKFEDLLTRPPKHRMQNLLLVGDTNNGKTLLLQQFYERHQPNDNKNGDAIILPVLLVEVPPVPDESSLYSAILEAMSAPHKKREHPDQKRFQVISIASSIGLRLLILDEIHNMLAGNITKQSGFRNAIKYLGNKLKIPIVAAGVQEAFQAIRSDDQLSNRFAPVRLPRWEIDKDYVRLLSSFERVLPLWLPSNLKEASLARKIFGLSEGLIGEMSDLLEKAAIKAIETEREKISVKLLDSLDWTLPSKRKWE